MAARGRLFACGTLCLLLCQANQAHYTSRRKTAYKRRCVKLLVTSLWQCTCHSFLQHRCLRSAPSMGPPAACCSGGKFSTCPAALGARSVDTVSDRFVSTLVWVFEMSLLKLCQCQDFTWPPNSIQAMASRFCWYFSRSLGGAGSLRRLSDISESYERRLAGLHVGSSGVRTGARVTRSFVGW